MGARKGWAWWEEYRCGCVSEEVTRKADMLGYCRYHGEDRSQVFHLPESAEAREEFRKMIGERDG